MSVQAGERFVFVAASGKRTEYEVAADPSTGEAIAAHGVIYKLCNVETGAIGWATAQWLREGPGATPARGYFEAAA